MNQPISLARLAAVLALALAAQTTLAGGAQSAPAVHAGDKAHAASTARAAHDATHTAPAGQPQVQIQDAWVRGTVDGQQATGVFMRLQAPVAARLVAVQTDLTAQAEIHEMRMQDGVMRMRAIPQLELPAGQPVELRPGGYHLMLMALKTPLQPPQSVPLQLHFRGAQGQEWSQTLHAPVRALGAGAHGHGSHGAGHHHDHDHHHHHHGHGPDVQGGRASPADTPSKK